MISATGGIKQSYLRKIVNEKAQPCLCKITASQKHQNYLPCVVAAMLSAKSSALSIDQTEMAAFGGFIVAS